MIDPGPAVNLFAWNILSSLYMCNVLLFHSETPKSFHSFLYFGVAVRI